MTRETSRFCGRNPLSGEGIESAGSEITIDFVLMRDYSNGV